MPWTEINGVKTFVAADATTNAVSSPRPTPGGGENGKNWFAQHKVATAVITAIVVIGGASAFSGGSDTTTGSSKAGSSSSPKTKAAPVPLTEDQKADKAAHGVKGAAVTQYGQQLEITYALNDLGGGLGRAKIAMDTFELMKGLKSQGVDFKTVTIKGTADMQDKFGSPLRDQHVFTATFDSATVYRIVYDNIDTGELDLLQTFATGSIYLHPAFGWER